ncbi:MAG: SGNH/GDSL hydrolase family protein [Bacteroidetes bacterium]|nr:SGNH/GDSL hydrolase family protein [Bacteroidota bacterium]
MNIFQLSILITLAVATSCRSKEKDTIIPKTQSEISYLALGDSYTIGQSVGPEERFPEQLADSLRKTGFKISNVRIVAKTGWTTDELQAGIDAAKIKDSTYTIVSLLIGVNNQYRGRPVSNYKPEFEALLQDAITFAGGKKEHVFVISIPDYAFTPFGQGSATITAEIDEYNAANKAIAEELGIRYFDITPISREGLANPSLVADDGLHPSGQQYGKWVSLMLPGVIDMLE